MKNYPVLKRNINGKDIEFTLTSIEIATIWDWCIENDWTPIDNKGKLPPKNFPVQLYVPDMKPFPMVVEGYLDENNNWHTYHYNIDKIYPTHWCPLTRPPKK